MSYQIYIASLTDYNAGVLHGVWIDCLEGFDEAQEKIQAMLDSSPTAGKTGIEAEEWAIHDSDFEGIKIDENSDLEDLCDLAEIMEDMDSDEEDAFAAFWNRSNYSTTREAKSGFHNAYQGTYRDLAEWAEIYAEETGLLDSVPENLRYYFDFEKYSRDGEIGGDIFSLDVPGGVAVFWGNY